MRRRTKSFLIGWILAFIMALAFVFAVVYWDYIKKIWDDGTRYVQRIGDELEEEAKKEIEEREKLATEETEETKETKETETLPEEVEETEETEETETLPEEEGEEDAENKEIQAQAD